jgi:hypothetical protein
MFSSRVLRWCLLPLVCLCLGSEVQTAVQNVNPTDRKIGTGKKAVPEVVAALLRFIHAIHWRTLCALQMVSVGRYLKAMR